jgi:hypothetical protein
VGAALVVVIAGTLAALPEIVRRVAISKIAAATGRAVAIEKVELNFFTGRLMVKAFRLADRARPDPFVQFDQLTVRFRLPPLVTGLLRLDEVTLAAPALRVVRTGPTEFNFSDLMAAPAAKAGPEPPKEKGLPIDVTVGKLTLAGGAIRFEDTVVSPPRTWNADGLAVEVADLSTRSGGPGGAASVSLTLAGTPISLKATELRVVPANARATLSIQGFDLALLLPYMPPEAPATLQSGRFSASLTLGQAGDTSRADGEVRLENLAVVRRGQAAPSLSMPALVVTLKDIVAAGGAVTAGRIEVAGDPTVFDTNLSPPPRFDIRALKAVVEGATWPPKGPARVAVTAEVPRGGSLEARGTVGLSPLAANLQIALKGIDLTLGLPYVPADSPATLRSGRLAANLTVAHAADAGSRADGTIRLENLVALRRGQDAPSLSVPALTIGLTDIVATPALDMRAGRVEAAGDPTVFDTNLSPPAQYDLKALKVVVEGATWPPRLPARVAVTAGLPRGGTFEARGPIRLQPIKADLAVALKDLDLNLAQPYLPIAGPVGGKAGANVSVNAALEGTLSAQVKGKAHLDNVGLGPAESPAVRAEAVDVDGIDVQWPTNVTVARILIRKFLANVERDRNAAFPLLGMLQRARAAGHVGDAPPTPPQAQPAPAPPAPAGPAPAPPQAPAAAGPRLGIDIGEIVLEDGLVRFADNSISPPQREELSRLAASVKGLSNAEGKRARLDAQGVVGATGAIEWHGEIAPLAEKLYVDMDVELRNFAIPRTNPRLQNLLAWTAQDGQLTTKLKIKLDGDKLDANSDIVVGRLSMVPGGEGDEAKRRIGLPLGMIIGLMKDARGEIRLSVPVSGSLRSPEFNLTDAIWSAVRNIIKNIVLAPFRAIGRLFTRDDKIESLSIDPVQFGSGTAALAPGAEEHLKKVAEVLQKAPAIKIGLAPVVTEGDLLALKTQEVTARLQRIQREQRLATLEAAGARLFAERFPGKPPPKTLEEVVTALRDAEPNPAEAGRALAGRRLEVTREALVKGGQIEASRLQAGTAPAAPPAAGEGRVEFAILP